MIIGKNILGSLTSGMYSDSKVIYREYIQNACDQIDIAINEGLIDRERANIDIVIDAKKRNIIIRDNATGVKAEDFEENVYDIANSNKRIGVNKGFRGIGRLCGLAYCKTLKFITSYSGESWSTVMTCDAQKMNQMLNDKEKYSLEDVWNAITKIEKEKAKPEEHYFEVQLLNINNENTDLLDQSTIKQYLSFIVPIPYSTKFQFEEQIYKHAQSLEYRLDEYNIYINGDQIFKEYQTNLKEPRGNGFETYDKIEDITFKDFYTDDGVLLAWAWVGISRFEKVIPKNNIMRCIRLRNFNIQIGTENTLQNFFKEDRGLRYFIGEIHAVHPELIPNSQRDYFNENPFRVLFEERIRKYFDELNTLYHTASSSKNAHKDILTFEEKKKDFYKKEINNSFVDKKQREQAKEELEKLKGKAEKGRKLIENLKEKNNSETPIRKVLEMQKKEYPLPSKSQSERSEKKVQEVNKNPKPSFLSSTFSNLTSKERKLVQKILSIIAATAPQDISEQIIARITKEFKK